MESLCLEKKKYCLEANWLAQQILDIFKNYNHQSKFKQIGFANIFLKSNQTHRFRERTYGCKREGWGSGQLGSVGQTRTYCYFKMDKQQGLAVQHRELCSVLCGSLDGRGVWRRRDTRMCMAESLRCPPETITTLLIGYTQYKIKSF